MVPNYSLSLSRAVWLLSVMLGLLPLLWVPASQGQTTSITSSGLNTKVTLNTGAPVPTYNITGGTRPADGTKPGTNLFHSFGDFSVGTHDRALFQNDSGLPTTNILARVTGGQASNIYGNIQSLGFGTAALWLINPAGIVFGPSASLNVGGSVHFSTADYLRLGSGNDRFYADLGKTSQLSSAAVNAFGFLGERPAGPVTVQGGSPLAVGEGKAISLVGGDIIITGRTLSAPAGQINLASLKAAGEAWVNPPGQSSGLDVVAVGQTRAGQQPTTAEGTVLIRGGALIGTVTVGNNAVLKTAAVSGGKEGNIDIEATTLNVGPGTLISAATSGSASDGNVLIAATDQITISSAAVVSGRTASGGTANVTLTSPRGIISVTKGASISTNVDPSPNDPFQAQASGSVYIRGGQFVMDASMITARSRGYNQSAMTPSAVMPVKGGVIDVEGETVLLTNQSAISTGVYTSFLSYVGTFVDFIHPRSPIVYVTAGDVNLKANSLITNGVDIKTSPSPNVFIFNSPNPGSIILQGLAGNNNEANSISLTDTRLNANASTSTANSVPTGGMVQVIARDMTLNKLTIDSSAVIGGPITLKSSNSIQALNSSLSNSTNEGIGGSLSLNAANRIDLTKTSISSTGLSADSGEIGIEAPTINVSGGNISASNFGFGRAGSVTLSGANITLSNGALLSVDSMGSGGGLAGDVALQGRNTIQLTGGSVLRATSSAASGGNIVLIAPNIIRLQDSQITTSVTSPTGNGGNVTIDPPAVVLQNSQIHANALQGHGGSIAITGNVVLVDPTSVLDASAGPAGVSGQVNIQAPIQQLSGAIAPLPQAFAVASNLYGQRCAAEKGGQFSSFVQGARDGVPPQPGDLIPSPLALDFDESTSSTTDERSAAFSDVISQAAKTKQSVTLPSVRNVSSTRTQQLPSMLTTMFQISRDCGKSSLSYLALE